MSVHVFSKLMGLRVCTHIILSLRGCCELSVFVGFFLPSIPAL